MNRDEFNAEVPPINRTDIPLVAPDIFRTKMAEETENIPMAVAGVLLLKGMPADTERKMKVLSAYVKVSLEMQGALKSYEGWPEMEFEEQVEFAADAIREKLWEYLSQPDEDATESP